jgi:phage terminase small subunit
MTDIVEPRNPKHKIFADAYLAGGSGTQAAIDAGYSVRTASVQAAQMLSKPEVAEYVRAMKAKSTEITGDSAVRWQQELGRAAYSNIADFITVSKDGNPTIDLSNATRDQLAAVQSIKTRKRTIYDKDGNALGEEHNNEIKLWDKLRAMELLGRHAGYLKDTESRVVIDVADRLLKARGRVIQSNDAIEYLDNTDETSDDDIANP